MTEGCPFCDQSTKNRALKESKFAFVILSNPRIAFGHLLVIPKRHVHKVRDLKGEEASEIFSLLAELQEKILNKISKGTEIRQNYKPYLPDSQTHVNHLHFHIVPRDEDDEIARKVDTHRKPLYQKLSSEEKERLFKLLKD